MPMFRIVIIISLLLGAHLNYAKSTASLYQIDLIVFTHQHNQFKESSSTPVLNLKNITTKPLRTDSKGKGIYSILPPSASTMRNEYWVLNRKSQYRVIYNYSWIQSLKDQHAVSLPSIEKDGWMVDGTFWIRKNQYFALDAELHFNPVNSNHSAFILSQTKRLKGEVVYYLDHPQAGMLVKIHKIS
jgi:hypothetical protein